MNRKHTELLRKLSISNNWISSAVLADELSISKRSIKNYVSEINSKQPRLILSSNRGYKVDISKVKNYLSSLSSDIPETSEERTAYLLKRLIDCNESLDLYELSDELFVSEATIKADLRKAKKFLSDHNLKLNNENDMIQLIGEERNKRKLISSILFTEVNDNFLDMEKLQNMFKDFDIDYIKDIVIEAFSTHHYFTNDYALTSIIVHLAIAVDRMRLNFPFQEPNTILKGKEHEETDLIAREIALKMEQHFEYKIVYSDEEIRDLSLLIYSNGTNINFMQVNHEELAEIAGTKCLNLVQNIIRGLHKYYYIEIDDSDFLIRFTLHLKNLLIRLEKGFSIKNPMTQTIKRQCPLIYDCAVQVSHTIKEETGYSVNDDEIAYIAFHLGFALELQKQNNSKINCSLVLPLYYDMNIQVIDKLKQYYSDDLLIQNIVTNESDLLKLETEFIISVVKFKSIPSIPNVVINPFFTAKDREVITSKIFDIKENKKKEQFKFNLKQMVNPEHFCITNTFNTMEQVLFHICMEMKKNNFVDSSFLSQVIEREAMSSTAFGAIAIPHSLTMDSQKTGMFILINKEGIQWGDSLVNIVLLLSVSSNHRKIFREVFDDLATIFLEERNIKRVAQSNNFDDFINNLVQCY